jgi:hypothetical protein
MCDRVPPDDRIRRRCQAELGNVFSFVSRGDKMRARAGGNCASMRKRTVNRL